MVSVDVIEMDNMQNNLQMTIKESPILHEDFTQVFRTFREWDARKRPAAVP